MARHSLPEQRSRSLSVGALLLFVLRLGGLMPFTAWFALGLLAGAWYAFEIHIARPPMFWMGEPKPTDRMNPLTWTRTLRNQGFMLGYSDLRGNPLWATYALTPPLPDAPNLKPPAGFATDWRGFNRVVPEYYNDNSGYSLGHLAPQHAIGLVYGQEGQQDACRMTNATPQKAGLSDKLWERLEELELNPFAKQFGKIWVTTGPIFDPPLERLHSSSRVEVPDAFYKIIVAPEAKKMLALVIPQTVRGDEPLEHYLTSVDAIEKRTGFDFFHELDDAEENRLESAVDTEPWHLRELARQPRHASHKADKPPSGASP
jgi:endonuclease G